MFRRRLNRALSSAEKWEILKIKFFIRRSLETTPQNVRISIESIPDLLPAAPEVVLPIEQSSNCEVDDVEKTEAVDANENKSGHHFLKVKKKKRKINHTCKRN